MINYLLTFGWFILCDTIFIKFLKLLFSSKSQQTNICRGRKQHSMTTTATAVATLEGKRDRQQESEVLDWIEAILGTKLDRSKAYEEILKDGVVLCKLINKIKPGSVKRINENSTMPFKIMENINAFQEAIKAYGVPNSDVFQTVDLFEKKDIAQVTQCIFALGRTCQIHDDFTGPTLGPKLAQENKREFSEQQLKEAANVVSLQYGSNKGASQAGMSMGKQRMILD
ncbi:hypothetical protein CRM22_002179 [Opisthorchis felineus]|nr:hypothetical protein CRM22_002179 [Opisthorchis felineus]